MHVLSLDESGKTRFCVIERLDELTQCFGRTNQICSAETLNRIREALNIWGTWLPRKGCWRKAVSVSDHNYQGLKFFDVDVAEHWRELDMGLAIDLYGEYVPAEQRLFPEDSKRVADFQKLCFDAMVRLDSDRFS